MSENDDSSDEYLTFVLDEAEYGIDILCVQEIRGWSPVTEVPNMPSYLRGVINLRGVIIPIVDMRERFSKSRVNYNPRTVVIVLSDTCDGAVRHMGIVVDGVSEVYKVARDEVRAPPDFGSKIESNFLHGMVTLGQKLVVLLDAKKLLDADEVFNVVDVAIPA